MSYDKTPLRPLRHAGRGGRRAAAAAGRHRCPVLVITSRQDHVVPPADSDASRLVSGPVERLVLERSYHVATVDYDKDLVFEPPLDFATKVTAA